MNVDKKEIIKIAKLAKLNFSEEEVEKFTIQFNEILQYMTKLNEINTDDVPPLSHPLDLTNVMREDKLKVSCETIDALLNAPEKDEQYFRVPKVIKDK